MPLLGGVVAGAWVVVGGGGDAWVEEDGGLELAVEAGGGGCGAGTRKLTRALIEGREARATSRWWFPEERSW
jgi:hypothetical protein